MRSQKLTSQHEKNWSSSPKAHPKVNVKPDIIKKLNGNLFRAAKLYPNIEHIKYYNEKMKTGFRKSLKKLTKAANET